MTKEEIGRALETRRNELGYTRTKVARELTIKYGVSVHVASIKSVEEASHAYTFDLLMRICDFYGLSLSVEK